MFANAILAMVTFIVTNVDDLLILTLYFSSPRFSKTQVVAGQFADIAFLISISIAGALTGQLVLHHWTSLLGLMPMYLGIKGLLEKDQDMRDSKEQSRTTYQWLQVGMVTIANGSDNVGVYVPLFVKLSLSLIVFYVLIFLFMTFVLCLLAYFGVSHPKSASFFNRIGHFVLPWFLILLGGYIIAGLFT